MAEADAGGRAGHRDRTYCRDCEYPLYQRICPKPALPAAASLAVANSSNGADDRQALPTCKSVGQRLARRQGRATRRELGADAC